MREEQQRRNERRDQLFKDLVRALGQEAERQGLTEEPLLEELKQNR